MNTDVFSLFATQILGNSLSAYAVAIGVFLVTFWGFHLLSFILRNRLDALAHKTNTCVDDVVAEVLRKIHPIEYAGIALYIALQTLILTPLLNKVIFLGFLALLTYMTVSASSVLLTSFLQSITTDENHQTTAPILMNLTIIGKALLWMFGIFLILSNAGVDINLPHCRTGHRRDCCGAGIAECIKRSLFVVCDSF